MQINTKQHLSFQGAIKLRASGENMAIIEKACKNIHPEFISKRFDSEWISIHFLPGYANNFLEEAFTGVLKSIKIPFIHWDNPNMTEQEFEIFHKFVKMG